MGQMTKPSAIREIIWDVDNARISKTSLKRVWTAMNTLGFDGDTKKSTLHWLEYGIWCEDGTFEFLDKFKGVVKL